MTATSIKIDDTLLHLSSPTPVTIDWIGQSEPLRQILACWMILGETDLPLTPRIIGHPGIGKTTLAMAAAKIRKQPLYIMQCTADTRPEDLLVTPVLSDKGSIAYHASPLLSAVITGGIVVLDEGNRMSEKSWASLASLFDHRRMVESVVAGITVTAHKEFCAAVTMNEDASTFEIPDYIMSRLQPGISIPFPSREEELKILSYNLPFAHDELLGLCIDFLQKAHELDLPWSIRDGLNIMRYTLKLKESETSHETALIFRQAIAQILGTDALDLDALAKRRERAGGTLPNMNLGDFFFDDNDDLNPDSHR